MSQAVAQAYDDIARAIQADSRAHLARQWAFERAAKCGFGVYRILTEYVNDKTFDQRIVYKRILNQASALSRPVRHRARLERRAVRAADAGHARSRATSWRTRRRSSSDYTDRELTSLGQRPADVDHHEPRLGGPVLPARRVLGGARRSRTLVLLPDDTTALLENIPADILATVERDRGAPLPRRTIKGERQVFWSLINGIEVDRGAAGVERHLHPAHSGHRRREQPQRRPALDGHRAVLARRAAVLQLHAERAGRSRRPRAARAVAHRRRAARRLRALVAAGEHAQPAVSAVSAADLRRRSPRRRRSATSPSPRFRP